jgi:C-terminal processing protease CtpA/Prc
MAALLLAGQAVAQTDEQERAAEARDRELWREEAAEREAEFAERMREAEERLAEAAAQVAELSAERLGSVANTERHFEFKFSDKPRVGVTFESEGDVPVDGIEITGVTPGSAGEEAGLRAGDVITSVNGESLAADTAGEAAMRLLEFMEGVEHGDTIEVEYLRDGKSGRLVVEPRPVPPEAWARALAPRMPDVPGALAAPDVIREFTFRGQPWRGVWGNMELVELSAGLGRYFGTDEGLLVVSAPKKNAFRLEDGDVILSIDGRAPSTVNHCMRILGSYEPGEKLVLDIMRDKQRSTLEVEVPDDRTSRHLPWLLRPAPAVAVPSVPKLAPLPAKLPARLPLIAPPPVHPPAPGSPEKT